MKSLGTILREIAERRETLGMTDADIEKRVTAYYAKAGYSCLTCFDMGTVGEKRLSEPPDSDESYGIGEVAHQGPMWFTVTCPDCAGVKGNAEDAALRRIVRAGLPFVHGTFDGWRTGSTMDPVFRHVRAWCDHPHGGIVLSGAPGLGKTHLLQAAADMLARSGVTVRYWEAPAMMDWLRQGIGGDGPDYQDRLTQLKETNILLIDDYGQGGVTEWSDSILEELLSHRYGWGKPWILATNTGPKQWGGRLASRFSDQSRVSLLLCTGADYRAQLDRSEG